MHEPEKETFENLLLNDQKLSDRFSELKGVLTEKFGQDSDMYERGVAVFTDNTIRGATAYGVPAAYLEYWKPYKTNHVLHHITIKKNIAAIKENGLMAGDPHPRPWAGMKAIFMGDPSDPLYARSEHAVIEYAKKKGSYPVLLHIKTENNLFKSVEPNRTFQVISVDPIFPTDIIKYEDVD